MTNTLKTASPMVARSIAMARLSPTHRIATDLSSGSTTIQAGAIHHNTAFVDKPLPKSPWPNARDSVLHRPRPIPRTSETSLFSRCHDPGSHRRSVSLDISRPKRSIVHASPLGSPSKLPPLPPIPPMSRLTPPSQSNSPDSSCHEVDILMLHHDPRALRSTSSGSSTRRRSASLPEVPTQCMLLEVSEPAAAQTQQSTELQTNTFADEPALETASVQSILPLGEHSGQNTSSRHSSSPSQASAASEARGGASQNDTTDEAQEPHKNLKTLSSYSSPSQSTSRYERLASEATISPGSIRSPGLACTFQKAHQVQVQCSTLSPALETSQANTGVVTPPADEDPLSREEAIIEAHQSEKSDDGAASTAQVLHNSWHRRVGDDCPTFTARESTVKHRRGPPPAPLRLQRISNTMLIETEPSPLESPEYLLGHGEHRSENLKRTSQTSSIGHAQRVTLLADLETEMGAQEDQWKKLRHTIIRDSLSTINLSPNQGGFVAEKASTIWARLQETHGTNIPTLADLSRSRNHSMNPAAYKASDNASPSHLSVPRSRVSYVTTSHTTSQVGSPTPPDTDEIEAAAETELAMLYMQSVQMAQQDSSPKLWRLEAQSPTITKLSASLWSPSFSSSLVPVEATGLSSPVSRVPSWRSHQPLDIESSKLWSPQVAQPTKASPGGLWGSFSRTAGKTEEFKEPTTARINPKPVVEKPVRKFVRISELPDILESPKPMPDKRGTLGIFQFAWGEKSATGVVSPAALNPVAISGTMTSGGALINPTFASGVASYGLDGTQPPSFYDDDDEEDIGDNFSDSEYDDEDDGFDEATIWEIATLLQPSHPSSESPTTTISQFKWMRSGTRSSVVASPTGSFDSLTSRPASLVGAVDAPRPTEPKPVAMLWKGKSFLFQANTKTKGLPQPGDKAWNSYLQAADSAPRTHKRRIDPIEIASSGLWSASAPLHGEISSTSPVRLWAPDSCSVAAK